MPRRNTKSQTTILNCLSEADTALSHEDISAKVGKAMDRVTIYRILNRFVEDGRVHRIVADDGRQYFASCAEGCTHAPQDHGHVHFRCVVCETVECVPGQLEYGLPTGYSVENANIVLSGRCGACGG